MVEVVANPFLSLPFVVPSVSDHLDRPLVYFLTAEVTALVGPNAVTSATEKNKTSTCGKYSNCIKF